MYKFVFVLTLLVLPCGAFLLALRAAGDLPQRIHADGDLLRLRVEGVGAPAVVFEKGLGGILDEWAAVLPEIASITRVAAYDRLGSNRTVATLTGEEVARQLHAVLEKAGVEPPYVLVGHSFGGVYSRIFASMFPDETAGLVLLDPSQEEFIAWMKTHHPETDYSGFDTHDWPEGAGIKATLEQLKKAGPLPDVPTVVVTGARPSNDLMRIEVLPVWMSMHAAWIKTRPQGRHVIAAQSGHGVHVEAPDVVIEEICNVIREARRAGWQPSAGTLKVDPANQRDTEESRVACHAL